MNAPEKGERERTSVFKKKESYSAFVLRKDNLPRSERFMGRICPARNPLLDVAGS
jgi:hypothetical protein